MEHKLQNLNIRQKGKSQRLKTEEAVQKTPEKNNNHNRNNFEICRLLSFYSIQSLTLSITAGSILIYYKNARNLAKILLLYFDESNDSIKCSVCNTTINGLNIKDLILSEIDVSNLHQCNDAGASSRPDNVPIQDENNYSYEESRLLTFLKFGWPLYKTSQFKVGALELANSGFVCLCDEDAAKCYFCRLDIRGWDDGDTADSEHRKWNNVCPFLTGNELITNIPLYSNHSSLRYETDSACITVTKPGIINEKFQNSEFVVKASAPKHEQYRLYETRLQSYTFWPSGLTQKPRELAEAGFYYTGKGDRVICFQCGGGLTDWSKNDKPWVEHATWFDSCEFLRLNKSSEFISSVKNAKLFSKSAVTVIETKTEEETTKNLTFKGVDTRLCKICYQNDMSIVYLPCGHLISCIDCAPQTKNCEYCRKQKQAFVKVFLPA